MISEKPLLLTGVQLTSWDVQIEYWDIETLIVNNLRF